MSKTRNDAQTSTLIQRLRCCRGLERFGEKDLRDMEWPKMEKIFVELFMRVGEKSLRDCADEREGQKKSMAAAEKRRTEDAYQSIFLRLAVKKLVEEMRYRSEVTAADLVHNRREFYAAIEFLLDRDSKADESETRGRDWDEGADGRKGRHAVGRSTVGNARLLGSGDGHRPLLRGAGEVVERHGGKGGGHTSRSDGRIDLDQQEEEEAFELSAGQTAARQVRYMQEEMSRLKKENKAMRNEKLDVEAIYQQLVSEQKHEKFEQRRLNLLKAQNLQLERQLAVMQRALSSRREAAAIGAAALSDLEGKLLSEGEDGQQRCEARETTECEAMLALVRAAQGKLQAAQQVALAEPSVLQRQLYYSRGNGAEQTRTSRRSRGTPPSSRRNGNGRGDAGAAGSSTEAQAPPRQSFVNEAHTNLSVMDALSVALTDESDGDTAVVRHLDLHALSTLETSLGALAPKLVALRQGLMTVSLPHMLSPMEERVAALARECCNDAHGAAYDLSTLRCLLPTAPLAAPSLSQQAYTPPPPSKIHQPDSAEILSNSTINSLAPMPGLDQVLMQLPPWSQTQERSGRAVLGTLLDYVNAREEWLKVALESMSAEQAYYGTCHSVQNEYVQRLCEEVEQRQATAHDDGATLHDIIKSFDAFETNTSEGTLRTFLKVFKHHHSKLGSLSTRLSKRSLSQTLMRDLDELQSSFKERYSRLLEKRLRTEREAKVLEQAASVPPGASSRDPAPPADGRGGGSRGRTPGSEEGGI